MKSKVFLIWMLVGILGVSWTVAAKTPYEVKQAKLFEGEGVLFVAGEVVVGFTESVTADRTYDVIDALEAGILKVIPELQAMTLVLPAGLAVRAAVEFLEAQPGVKYAHPNYIKQLYWEPNDWYFKRGHLWNFEVVGAPAAWDLDTTAPIHGGDPDVVVAVIDTGVSYMDYVDTEHYGNPPGSDTVTFGKAPDFQNTRFTAGWNFVDDTANAVDDVNHGTHVTMTIAQSTNNDPSGVENDYSGAGLAFECTIMPLKVIKQSSGANVADVAEAIIWAADHGAHVVNMSLGLSSPDIIEIEYEACQYAYEHNVVLVAATGNDADGFTWSCQSVGVGSPAHYPMVIGAGASQNFVPGSPDYPYELRTSYSQWGYGCEIVAPGGDYYMGDIDGSGKTDEIWQQTFKSRSYPNLNEFKAMGFAGTSMASPHVAAAAALIISHYKTLGVTLTVDQVRNRLTYSADDLYGQVGKVGYDYESGFGRLNILDAMTQTPLPKLAYKNVRIDEASGNGNLRIENGETGNLIVGLYSLFADVTGVFGTLSTSDPYVEVVNHTRNFGDTQYNQLLTNQAQPFVISVAANCPVNHVATFELNLQCNEAPAVPVVFHAKVYYPPVLFVDDDQQNSIVPFDTYYTNALNAAGVPYHYYNVVQNIDCENEGDEILFPFEERSREVWPDLEMISRFDLVIWNLGYCYHSRTRLQEMEQVFASYLDSGGRLFFSGHEYLFKLYRPEGTEDIVDLPTDSFPYQYLHIDRVEHDEFYFEVFGVEGDPISNGMHINLQDVYSSPSNPKEFRWWPDDLNVRSGGVKLLKSGPNIAVPEYEVEDDTTDVLPNGAAAVRVPASISPSDNYRVIFCAFPVEGMVNSGVDPDNIQTFLERSIMWLLDCYGDTTGLELTLNKKLFTAGDPFALTKWARNPGPALGPVKEVIVLDVYGSYFFWPSWGDSFGAHDVNLTACYNMHELALGFVWPDGDNGSAEHLYFYGAFVDNAVTQMVGELSMVEFGFY